MKRNFKQAISASLRAIALGGMLVFVGCTDRIESTLPPVFTPTPAPQGEVPIHLRTLFADKCAACHGQKGEGGVGGNIYRARSRSPRNWATFLKKPQSIEPASRHPQIDGLNDVEYAAFGEWLARVTRDNRPK